jgi:hypothetical protein
MIFKHSVKFHWLDKFLLYTVTDQKIAFLVPDLCRAMMRNGNSVYTDMVEDTIENY